MRPSVKGHASYPAAESAIGHAFFQYHGLCLRAIEDLLHVADTAHRYASFPQPTDQSLPVETLESGGQSIS